MTYKPGDVTTFPDDDRRELVKIAAAFQLHADAIGVLSARIQALEARPIALVPAPAPAPSASADVLWRWNAASLAPFGVQAAAPDRVLFTQAGGRNAVRLLTMSGDSNIAGSDAWERCDLQLSRELTDGYEGREAWWAHSIWFPDDYVDPPESPENAQPWHGSVLFDFHNTTQGAWQANYQVMGMPRTATSPDRPRGICAQIAFGNQAQPTTIPFPASGTPGIPVVRNAWYDFKYHVRWTSASTGVFDAWVNGKPFLTYRGPTLYAGQGVYLKLANYHSPHGKASAVLHGPIVLAKTEAALA